VDQRLPVRQRQLIGGGAGLGDDGAAADRIDEDVDAPEALDGVGDHAFDLAFIERIGVVGMGLAAGGRDLGNGCIQPLAIDVHGGDASTFRADDVGGRATDPACRRRDECDLALETHDLAPPACRACALRCTLHRPGRSSKGLPYGKRF